MITPRYEKREQERKNGDIRKCISNPAVQRVYSLDWQRSK
jgi:hypothetical protein